MNGYWARDFTSRLMVQSGIVRITLPLDHVINITSINQLRVSNWLEIEGTIDYPQKNLSIAYNARPRATDNFGYFNTTGNPGYTGNPGNTGTLSTTDSRKDSEKKR
jgi:hypothetical protein